MFQQSISKVNFYKNNFEESDGKKTAQFNINDWEPSKSAKFENSTF